MGLWQSAGTDRANGKTRAKRKTLNWNDSQRLSGWTVSTPATLWQQLGADFGQEKPPFKATSKWGTHRASGTPSYIEHTRGWLKPCPQWLCTTHQGRVQLLACGPNPSVSWAATCCHVHQGALLGKVRLAHAPLKNPVPTGRSFW